MKSGSLNLLEPSGPVKACNGIALPLFREPQITLWKVGEDSITPVYDGASFGDWF
jgi:hypothetical protein